MLRHRIVHVYGDIDDRLVWMTVQDDLPELIERLKASSLDDRYQGHRIDESSRQPWRPSHRHATIRHLAGHDGSHASHQTDK